MTDLNGTYDWAAAVLSVKQCSSNNIGDLAEAAHLDPKSGDLIDIDLSGLDLRGQDFSGWDLSLARFENTLIAGAKFTDAKLDPQLIIDASDWELADLPGELKADAQFNANCRINIENLILPLDLRDKLVSAGFLTIGDLLRRPIWQIEGVLEEMSTEPLEHALKEQGFVPRNYRPKVRSYAHKENGSKDRADAKIANPRDEFFEAASRRNPSKYSFEVPEEIVALGGPHYIAFSMDDEYSPDDDSTYEDVDTKIPADNV